MNMLQALNNALGIALATDDKAGRRSPILILPRPAPFLAPYAPPRPPLTSPYLRLSAPVIFGEDVAFGGVFRCTLDLLDKFGPRGALA